MQNGQFGSKFKNAKKVHKNDCKTFILELIVCKKPLQKRPNIRKKPEHFKNGQNSPKAWVIAHAKWSVWVKI